MENMLVRLVVIYLKLSNPKMRKFKEWAKLEQLTSEIIKAVESDITKFPEFVNEYISTALRLPIWFLNKIPWHIPAYLYTFSKSINTPNKIPILANTEEGSDVVSWDYPGRNWNYWSHVLAKSYGWSLEYIAALDTNTALSHLQEIFTDEQLSHEFTWSTTEIAYPYNATTKQSRFSPLERPYWMLEKAKPVRTFKMAKSMLPTGLVNDVSGMEKHVKEKIQAKNIDAN